MFKIKNLFGNKIVVSYNYFYCVDATDLGGTSGNSTTNTTKEAKQCLLKELKSVYENCSKYHFVDSFKLTVKGYIDYVEYNEKFDDLASFNQYFVNLNQQ